MNAAIIVADAPEGIVTVHVALVPEQLPPHSLNELPVLGVAVRTTVRGAGEREGPTAILADTLGRFSLQSDGQWIPVPVTFPFPVTDMVSV